MPHLGPPFSASFLIRFYSSSSSLPPPKMLVFVPSFSYQLQFLLIHSAMISICFICLSSCLLWLTTSSPEPSAEIKYRELVLSNSGVLISVNFKTQLIAFINFKVLQTDTLIFAFVFENWPADKGQFPNERWQSVETISDSVCLTPKRAQHLNNYRGTFISLQKTSWKYKHHKMQK